MPLCTIYASDIVLGGIETGIKELEQMKYQYSTSYLSIRQYLQAGQLLATLGGRQESAH